MLVQRFRKKPVTIEALQFYACAEGFAAAREFVGADAKCRICGGSGEYEGEYGPLGCMACLVGAFYIETLEGQMAVLDGDWIIRGVAGDFYPCRDDIFRQTYEAVE